MPWLRRALRQGGVSVVVPRPLVPLRLRLRGARAPVRRLHAEDLRGGDRPRDAPARRTAARRLRRSAGDPRAAADVPLGDRVDVRAPHGRARLRQPGVQGAAGGIADVPGVRPADLTSGTRRSTSTPTSGHTAATANASRHEVAATRVANAGVAIATITPSTV